MTKDELAELKDRAQRLLEFKAQPSKTLLLHANEVLQLIAAAERKDRGLTDTYGGQIITLAGTIGAILVRHGVIDRAAIEDPEGYDGGQTNQRVIDATIAIAKEVTPLNP